MKRVIKGGEKHEFAFFVPYLSSSIAHLKESSQFELTDEKIFHRIVNVLRLQPSDRCIFFDQTVHIYFLIGSFVGKKQIRGIIHAKRENQVFKPHITFLLPVLKRDDFNDVLYSLAEIGVNTIQLIQTQKSQRPWSQHELEHAQNVIISAAEQSKNFSYPVLKSPVTIETASENDWATKILFDTKGQPAFDVMQKMYAQSHTNVALLIGPEGDLTEEEKTLIEKKGFIFCALTPTVLRSAHAAALGAGFVRSIFTHRLL